MNSNDLVKLNQSKSFYDADCLGNQALVFCYVQSTSFKKPTACVAVFW